MRGQQIFTIGHSINPLRRIVELVRPFEIDTLVDVRSHPVSSRAPEFNRVNLGKVVANFGLRYVFMGDSLGGRPVSPDHYDDTGRALYYEMAKQEHFLEGWI